MFSSRNLNFVFHNFKARTFCASVAVIPKGKYYTEQLQYLDKSLSELTDNEVNWSSIKNNILNKRGNITSKNINAVFLKVMTKSKKLNHAMSFSNYLKNNEDELSLGTINSLLALYYKIGKENKLADDNKAFILNTYRTLMEKYEVVDCMTGENLLHALCIIDEWQKSLLMLDDINKTNTPSHSAYSTLISTLLQNDEYSTALNVIQRSLSNRRQLLDCVYKEWINYILRKNKTKNSILENIDKISMFVQNNFITLSFEAAEMIKNVYVSLGWNANYTKIRKSGQCANCKRKLTCFELTDEEFSSIHKIVKEKLIVGSDLFLKTSPTELERFTKFLKETAPYDVVLDALNIAFSMGVKVPIPVKVDILSSVANYFLERDKNVMLLGRKHMLGWSNSAMKQLINKTNCFFIEDLSQDDPYFLTAAILSGPETDIVSKDIFRGHKFNLGNEKMGLIFQRWQWQHQWMVYTGKSKGTTLIPPLQFTPSAQSNKFGWHFPLQNDNAVAKIVNDGVPDLTNWLCLLKPR